MKNLKNITVGGRCITGFSVVLLIMIIITIIGLRYMAEIQTKLDEIYRVNYTRIALANEMKEPINTIYFEIRNILLQPDQTQKLESFRKIQAQRPKYAEAFSKLKKLEDTSKGNEMLLAIENSIAEAKTANDQIVELGLAGKTDEALAILIKKSEAERALVETSMQKVIEYQEERMNSNYNRSIEEYTHARILLFIFSGLALLFGIIIAFLLTRSITIPMSKLIDIARTASSGDLRIDFTADSTDEIGHMAEAFKIMLDNMKNLVGEIMEKATTVASSSEQLNDNAQQTSANANETAATIGEIAIAVEQVTTNIQDISNASMAADDYAKKGKSNIELVTNQMNNISESTGNVSSVIAALDHKSREINQIVELITSIADQTNLLALNAAIEAGRAGEQGRGFAVVAEEVRKLAEQSAQAAREIKELITSIQQESKRAVENMNSGNKEVEEGTRIVSEIGDSFNYIITAVQDLNCRIQESASATEQSSAGIQQVAATAEEQTASIQEVTFSIQTLKNLAEDLNKAVEKFKI